MKTPTRSLCLVLIGAALVVPAAGAADAPKPTPQQVEFFEKSIRPILADACYSCHSAKDGKKKGGLTLDSRQGWVTGGDSGPAIVPGDPDKSLFIKAVRYNDEALQMPPKGEKLSPEKISLLEQWVKMGAPDPRDGKVVEATVRDLALKHWAFQPVKKQEPPEVKDKAWVKNPVDAFVLAKLEAKGITPSKRADNRTLIRRATLDLTGLPPTMDEFDNFMKDRSATAYERAVDRLLKSPQFGERWGRHWLDVARYADTKGDVDNNREDFRFPYAWTYRDYVIQSYNDDKPFDRFILEQLAADKLTDRRDDRALAGLGFITVGKRFGNDNNEVIDDRIDAVTKGFLGLTVTCARCHDHKFDPVPTKDYYSLHGIFNSINEPRDLPPLAPLQVTPDYQIYTNELAKLERELDTFQDRVVGEVLLPARTNAAKYLYVHWELSQPTNQINRFIFVANNRRLDNGIYGRWENALRSAAQRKHDPVLAPWVEFAKLLPIEFATTGKELAAKLAANKDDKKPINRWVAQALLGTPPASMADLSARYDQLFKRADAMWRENISRPKPLDALADKDWEQIRQFLYGKGGPSNPSEAEILAMQGQRIQGEQQRIRSRMVDLHMNHPGSPARAMVVADSANPRNTRVYIRGNARNLGDEAPRRFLEALSNGEPQPFKIGSGRLELAQAIANRDNPLTARVYVNRVWMHLFGEGFVRSPSDFGTRAEAPSHPELLDWLAGWFMDNGWSTKKLIRLVMTSNTYQQSSDDNPRFAQLDPANYLLWRQNVRRAEFEVLRDSILAIGGKLDLEMGGPPVNLTAEPFPTRRTVYGLVDRRALASVYTTFDFANPDLSTGQRYVTTVPQQALFLMNNPLVVEQSRNLVTRPDFAALKTEDERVKLLYRLIYQREPKASEMSLATKYLSTQGGSAGGQTYTGPVWQYGYGEYSPQTKRVHGFTPMGHFTRERGLWTPKETADRAFGALSLTAQGGHPGPTIKTAAIRRWTSPVDGSVELDGTLGHTNRLGDGVIGIVVSSRLGEIGRYQVANSQAQTRIPRIPVAKGETIDFVVVCLQNPNYDFFNWSPQLRMHTTASTTAGADGRTTWNARNDFSGPSATEQRPMDAWERFAQVLLLTNELIFIN